MSGIIGTVLLGANAASVVNKIGADVVITAVTTSTSAVGKLLGYITTMDHVGVDDIKTQLDDIDLDFFITVLDQLVKELHDMTTTESIKLALIGMTKILDSIHTELHSIKKAIEEHHNKYFCNWRSFNCAYNIDTIKKHKNVLYERYKILTDLMSIYK